MTDIPLIREIALEAYPDRNIEPARPWMEWAIQSPEKVVLVGANTVGVAGVSLHYGFWKRARMDLLACRPVPGRGFEALRVIRIMLDWARQMGAEGTFRLDADTGIDFGPFAKRLGGKPLTSKRYELPL